MQGIVTTMDSALSRQSVDTVCVHGGTLRSSCERHWWESLCHLVARPFIRCSGRLFTRQWHVPHIPPVPCMCFFLSPGSSRSWRGLVSRHFFHNEVPVLQLPSKLVLGTCLFLVWFVFSWATRRLSWAPNKLCWPARRSCSKLCKQALR